MYHNGKSIKDIALIRKLKQQTIESHLITCYEMGKDININQLGFTSGVYNQIKQVLLKTDDGTRLRDIKAKLPNISYFYINLARIVITDESKYAIK